MVATTTEKSPRRTRGLFDALLCGLLIYAVYAATPVGALVENAIRAGLGQKNRTSLWATFSGRKTSVQLDPTVFAAPPGEMPIPSSVLEAAQRNKVAPDILFAWVQTHGQCQGGACSVTTPQAFEEWVPTGVREERISIMEAARALARAQEDVGPGEPALEAVFVGRESVRRALGQADASGLEQSRLVVVHGDFFSPGIRRGPLKDALAILARHRLSTLAWPMAKKFPITSPFGMRKHPVTGKMRLHNGMDIGAGIGNAVLASHLGKVKRRGEDSTCGRYLRVDHGFGIETTYCHLDAAKVSQGKWVKQRATIAASGKSGRVTGPHLHFILRLDGQAVDPMLHLEKPKT